MESDSQRRSCISSLWNIAHFTSPNQSRITCESSRPLQSFLWIRDTSDGFSRLNCWFFQLNVFQGASPHNIQARVRHGPLIHSRLIFNRVRMGFFRLHQLNADQEEHHSPDKSQHQRHWQTKDGPGWIQMTGRLIKSFELNPTHLANMTEEPQRALVKILNGSSPIPALIMFKFKQNCAFFKYYSIGYYRYIYQTVWPLPPSFSLAFGCLLVTVTGSFFGGKILSNCPTKNFSKLLYCFSAWSGNKPSSFSIFAKSSQKLSSFNLLFFNIWSSSSSVKTPFPLWFLANLSCHLKHIELKHTHTLSYWSEQTFQTHPSLLIQLEYLFSSLRYCCRFLPSSATLFIQSSFDQLLNPCEVFLT